MAISARVVGRSWKLRARKGKAEMYGTATVLRVHLLLDSSVLEDDIAVAVVLIIGVSFAESVVDEGYVFWTRNDDRSIQMAKAKE